MREPAEIVADLERGSEVPRGSEERFSGYGVMGLPFRSGHVLGLRRFPASSIGPGYRSVWHCDPHGRWTFYQDQAAELACTRYFGSAVDEVREGPVQIGWSGPRAFRVRAGELDWTVEVGSTPVTRVLNAAGSAIPTRAWRSRPVLEVMSRVAGTALRAGRVRLTGMAPNGQRFLANPSTMWVVVESHATLHDFDLGEMGPTPDQARLRDFMIPQRGVFVVGRATFTDVPQKRSPSSRPRPYRGRSAVGPSVGPASVARSSATGAVAFHGGCRANVLANAPASANSLTIIRAPARQVQHRRLPVRAGRRRGSDGPGRRSRGNARTHRASTDARSRRAGCKRS